MEIGIIIVLAAIIIGVCISDVIESRERKEAYLQELERTVERQERSLRIYRFNRLQKEIGNDYLRTNKKR